MKQVLDLGFTPVVFDKKSSRRYIPPRSEPRSVADTERSLGIRRGTASEPPTWHTLGSPTSGTATNTLAFDFSPFVSDLRFYTAEEEEQLDADMEAEEERNFNETMEMLRNEE